MNPLEFAIAALAIIFLFSLAKQRMAIRNRGDRPAEDSQETLRLREEVKQLTERLHVLERIATDKENSLSREIEELRDR